MAGIFESYRSRHHPDAHIRLPLATNFLNHKADFEQARYVLKRRDRCMWLEMESSSLAGILITALVSACPKKKFILTIRDVYSWCNSWLDHNINSPPRPSSLWAQLDQVRLRAKAISPTKYDAPLLERGLLPLECYFQLWQSHNVQVLETVPDDRLFVVKTENVIEMIPAMAQWLGILDDTLKPERGWLFAAPKKHKMLNLLDSVYVRETADAHCGNLMRQFFPDVTLR